MTPAPFFPISFFAVRTWPRTDQLIVALEVYLDESEDSGSGKAMALAGYVAPASVWTDFEPKWNAVLEEYAVPYFHMVDLHHNRDSFVGWGEERKIHFLRQLTAVIKEAAPYGVGSLVRLGDLARFNEDKSQAVEPMPLLIYGCSLELHQKFPGEDMRVLIDRRDKGHSEISKAIGYGNSDSYYVGAMDNLQISALKPTMSWSSKTILPLQAADFLAWELLKNYKLKHEWFENEKPSPDSPNWMSELLGWYIDDRTADAKKHNKRQASIHLPLMRRSLAALSGAAPIEGIIWDYRALCIAHEARGGVWGADE